MSLNTGESSQFSRDSFNNGWGSVAALADGDTGGGWDSLKGTASQLDAGEAVENVGIVQKISAKLDEFYDIKDVSQKDEIVQELIGLTMESQVAQNLWHDVLAEQHLSQSEMDERIQMECFDFLHNAVVEALDNQENSEEYLQNCLQLSTQLGLEVPLRVVAEDVDAFVSLDPGEYDTYKYFGEHGLIAEDFDEAVYQAKLKKVFRNDEIPESLSERSETMREYWNHQSEKMDTDALYSYLHYFGHTSNPREKRRDAGKMPLVDSVDENGLPNPAVFEEGSGFINEALYNNRGNFGELAEFGIKFLRSNVEKLEDPTARFLVTSSADLPFSEESKTRARQFNFFRVFAHDVQQPGNMDENGQPNEKFWAAAFFSRSDMVTLYADQYSEEFSPSQLACLKQMDRYQRDEIKTYITRKNANNDTSIWMLDGMAEVNEIVDANGELSENFLKQIDNLDGPATRQLLEGFADQLEGKISPEALSYLQLSHEEREEVQKQFRYAVYDADGRVGFAPQVSAQLTGALMNSLALFAYDSENTDVTSKIVDSDKMPDKQKHLLSAYLNLDCGEKTKYARAVYQMSAINLDLDNLSPDELDRAMVQQLFRDGRFDLLNLSDSNLPMEDDYLSDVQKQILQLFDGMDKNDDSMRMRFKSVINELDLNKMTVEDVRDLGEMVERISDSNAIELRRAGGNFLQQLATSSGDSLEELDNIEQVFLKNNLPYVGKVFKTFQIIHPAEKDFGGIGYVMNRGALEVMPDTGMVSKEAVLFADLMKTSIDSNSRSMRAWIKQMRAENPAYIQTAYNQTIAGRENPVSGDTNMDELRDVVGVTPRHSAADRIVRSFGYMLGLGGLDDLENRMNQKVSEADARGRQRFMRGDFTIDEGDLVKAIKDEYIGDMLSNGIVCKEFLNGEASSDSTPLDADLTRITEEVDGSIGGGIAWKNAHAAFGAMRVNLVMKGDERFVTEEQERQEGYRAERFALWNNGGSDQGIRVGFPSSAIDFITFDPTQSKAEDSSFLFQEIAKNGFYIPVVDQVSGECIFSPDDFDELRQKLSGLEIYGGGDYQFAADEDLVSTELGEIAKGLIENDHQVESQRAAIDAELGRILADNYEGFHGLKTEADGDLTPGFLELIDTGSTGRGTSVPGGEIDFDFIMRVDGPVFNDRRRKKALEDMLRQNLRFERDESTDNGLRLRGVEISGVGDPVDLDISLVQRTNRLEFSTDMAVKERLEAMYGQDAVRAQFAVANIVKAKEVLKSADAYKPQHSTDTNDPLKKGGLGGVGVENWILQNGGSLKNAARDFLAAADRAGGDFETFKDLYPIWDAGQNHFSVRDNERSAEVISDLKTYIIPYDNFVTRNMDAGGFGRMTLALRNYLSEVEGE